MPDGYGTWSVIIITYHLLMMYTYHILKLNSTISNGRFNQRIRPPKSGEKYFPLIDVEDINGKDPSIIRDNYIEQHHLLKNSTFEMVKQYLTGT